MTFFSRSDRVCRTESSCSWSRMKLAASTGTTASESSMKSPRWESSSSPIGVSSDTGSWRHLEDLADLLGRELHLAADLLGGGLAAQVLEELALDADQLVDRLDHVHRDADGAGLVGDGPGDGLADPPGGVGGELEALVVVELLHGPDEAEVALLDEVEEQHAPAHVPLGDRHHQAQVGLDQLLLGQLAVAFGALQLPQTGRAELAAVVGGLVDLGGWRPRPRRSPWPG
jgi:hypothetical protein